MRIIAGTFRGRKLSPPQNLPVRPTTDLAKESLFNILRSRVDLEECDVLDLFCGTGSIGLEFASRGAKRILSVDSNARCIDFVKKTAEQLNISNLFALRNDAFFFLGSSQQSFDIVFADPPYDLKQFDIIPDLVLNSFVKQGGLFILEHSKEHNFQSHACFVEQRNYGKVNFSFFAYKK
jgi:16S rRNA (guanine(966)-N(2))-methyltransferase RsmD